MWHSLKNIKGTWTQNFTMIEVSALVEEEREMVNVPLGSENGKPKAGAWDKLFYLQAGTGIFVGPR